MSRAAAILLAMAAAAAPAAARAEQMVTALSGSRVEITSTYTGAEIVAFGVIERDLKTVSRAGAYDVVVTVRGPARNFIVRQKERVGFAWLNREQRRFIGVPSYLSVLSSRPLPDITSPQLQRRLRVGVDTHLSVIPDELLPERERAYRVALRRIEGEAGRFVEDPAGVAFLTPTLFRASIYLPATARTGLYEVETQLFADGTPLARAVNTFEVAKTGFEQRIAEAAHQARWAYGFAVAAISLLFGWLASIVFRRD